MACKEHSVCERLNYQGIIRKNAIISIFPLYLSTQSSIEFPPKAQHFDYRLLLLYEISQGILHRAADVVEPAASRMLSSVKNRSAVSMPGERTGATGGRCGYGDITAANTTIPSA